MSSPSSSVPTGRGRPLTPQAPPPSVGASRILMGTRRFIRLTPQDTVDGARQVRDAADATTLVPLSDTQAGPSPVVRAAT